MRKTFIAAATATVALGVGGIAYAQTAPSISGTASISPSKAGSKSKPAASKFTLAVSNDPASKTTAKSITITFPSTLKLSTKGLTQCTASDNDIIGKGPAKACKGSVAGTGTAAAQVAPFSATPGNVNFKVTPIVGKNQLLFFLAATGGVTNKYVLHGKISGKKLTIAITPDVQQPIPGVYSALLNLKTTLSMKKGKNALITSTGCSGGSHKVGVAIGYANNPNPPAAPSASTTIPVKCS